MLGLTEPPQSESFRRPTMLGVTEPVHADRQEDADTSKWLLETPNPPDAPTEDVHDGTRRELSESETPVGSFPASTVLGISALVSEGVSVLFLLLPCFWFLALPISGLGFMLGGISLIVSVVRRDRGLVYGIISTAIGFFLTCCTGLYVLYVQARLINALDQLK
jgi:hypothetical protein